MTKEYLYLKQRLIDIKQTFDKIINPDPTMQSESQDIIKSYILLCHAEFEKYFEDIAINVIETAKNNYDKVGEIGLPLLSLTLMLKKDFKNESSKERLEKLFSNYHALIDGNHGIKSKDIEEIMAPIGLDITLLSDIYIEMLNNFGKKREKSHIMLKKQFKKLTIIKMKQILFKVY